MTQKSEQGSVVFIDVPTRIPDLSPSEGVTLLPLLDMIRDSIARIRGATPPLLIFDELACFEWIGHSSLDVSRFVRALVACCAKASMEPLPALPLLSKLASTHRATFYWPYDTTLLHSTTSIMS